ncbi:conserved hypothetical protein [Methylobacterium sp. 4-46]|uniref:hypothetical protein n=1 Tax=unclassified Methylobacterium TaxID=2615210 RepID=UPI000165CA05|nr:MULTISPECIES: hypothetical protein [Methylobacterium]ACA16075.1 conserved hypothetical protein [Methylobacterium sp. 4-46]WFT81787.1 hypothetical protein QA634_07975 [Methylobacterium nodulans]
MIRELTPIVLAFGLASPALAQAPAAPLAPSLLMHGNYCGLGNRAPLPPVDALDAACARHDACTPAGGLPSRRCNLRLQWEADRISRDPRQPDDVRAAAGFIAFSAALLPFDPAPPVVVVRVPAWTDPFAYRRVRAAAVY